MRIFGGAYRTAPELTSRSTNFRFARTWADWVWQPATGGDGGNRTRVRKSIRTGVSERRRLFKFPYKSAKRQADLLGSPPVVTAAGTSHRSWSPLK